MRILEKRVICFSFFVLIIIISPIYAEAEYELSGEQLYIIDWSEEKETDVTLTCTNSFQGCDCRYNTDTGYDSGDFAVSPGNHVTLGPRFIAPSSGQGSILHTLTVTCTEFWDRTPIIKSFIVTINYPTQLALDAKSEIESAQISIESAQAKIEQAEEKINEAKDLGIDTTSADNYLSSAKNYITSANNNMVEAQSLFSQKSYQNSEVKSQQVKTNANRAELDANDAYNKAVEFLNKFKENMQSISAQLTLLEDRILDTTSELEEVNSSITKNSEEGYKTETARSYFNIANRRLEDAKISARSARQMFENNNLNGLLDLIENSNDDLDTVDLNLELALSNSRIDKNEQTQQEDLAEDIAGKVVDIEAEKSSLFGIPLKFVYPVIAFIVAIITLVLRGREIRKWLEERKLDKKHKKKLKKKK